MRRASVLRLSVALQAALFAAACSFDRAQPHPLNTRRSQVAHLLRRAGFGASPETLDEFEALGLKGAVDRLVDYESVEDDVEERFKLFNLDLKKLTDLQRWWLLRMVYTRRPLQEKMTLFWHGLLTSASAKVGFPNPTPQNPDPPHHMLNQHTFFREHAVDRFEALLMGVARDPAMMIWLDAQTSVKGKPNENFARELLELFSLGISGPDGQPNYTESDVREVARAFTGFGLDQGRFVFRPAQHDAGPKTVFGKTGPFGGDDVIDLILAHPGSAPYICRRLFAFFAYPDPEPDVLTGLVQSLRGSSGSIRAVMRTLLTSRAFYSEKAYRATAKSPAEYVAGMARALELQTDAFNFQGSVQRMSQALFNPPNVSGWPGGAAWFNSTTWLERVNRANSVLGIRKDDHTQPVALLTFVQRHGLDTAERAVDFFLDLLVDGQVRPQQRQVLVDYVNEGSLWKGAPTRESEPAVDRKLRGLVYLILASPEYQLA